MQVNLHLYSISIINKTLAFLSFKPRSSWVITSYVKIPNYLRNIFKVVVETLHSIDVLQDLTIFSLQMQWSKQQFIGIKKAWVSYNARILWGSKPIPTKQSNAHVLP